MKKRISSKKNLKKKTNKLFLLIKGYIYFFLLFFYCDLYLFFKLYSLINVNLILFEIFYLKWDKLKIYLFIK